MTNEAVLKGLRDLFKIPKPGRGKAGAWALVSAPKNHPCLLSSVTFSRARIALFTRSSPAQQAAPKPLSSSCPPAPGVGPCPPPWISALPVSFGHRPTHISPHTPQKEKEAADDTTWQTGREQNYPRKEPAQLKPQKNLHLAKRLERGIKCQMGTFKKSKSQVQDGKRGVSTPLRQPLGRHQCPSPQSCV